MQERPVADVKRDFKRVLDDAERGESTVVLRHGKPVALIGPLPVSSQRRPIAQPAKAGDFLSLVGSFVEWPEIEEDIAEIIASRQLAQDRPPPTFD